MNATPQPSHRRFCRAILCVLLCGALLPVAEARGERGGHRGGFRFQGEGHPRGMERLQRPMSPRQQQRDLPPIERPQPRPPATPGPGEGQGRPPVFQPAEPPPADPSSRPGRLTPDERRALRQQINEAGRDIYRPGRP